jgi:hypothetical protein
MPELNVQLLSSKIQEVLEDLLGVAKYPNNFNRPAIFVGNPPNNINVEGLVVILPLFPNVDKSQHLSNSIYRKDNWKIILEQRKGCTATTFAEACHRMTTYFHNANLVYLEQNSIVGSYTQAIITYRHSDLYAILR